MARDRMDFLKVTNDDILKEYELIKQKKSMLPANQRRQIIEAVEATNAPTNK